LAENNRSPGLDNIVAELLKIKQEIMEATFHKIVCQIWRKEIVPEQWEDGLMCPIHKQGDQLELNNCVGITVLITRYKKLPAYRMNVSNRMWKILF
jgi:hypothetical protein